jgi:hypothetical protein
MTFLHKRVGEGNAFGADLRDLRDHKGVTIEDAARHTKIHDALLRAFEGDRVEDIEDPLFAERHLRMYVQYVGGYEPYFLGRYRARCEELQRKRKAEDLLPRTRGVRSFDLFIGAHLTGILGVLLLALFLGGYVLWQAHLVRIAPPLTVDAPTEGQVLTEPRIDVRGQTIPEAYVNINGHDVPVDPHGGFVFPMDVRRGTTVIHTVARRRRGSETVIDRRVVYDRALNDVDALTLPTASSTP